jgi:regulatory GntR family protein/substrate-binding family protein
MSTTNAQPPQSQQHKGHETSSAGATPPPPPPPGADAGTSGPSSRMSYKFQRLREKLRQAVASGELSGKLPGERALAKRFHVNAKTLSKALTDLAAEGLLDRSIGRGTYVKGSAPPPSAPGRWLILVDEPDDPGMGCLLEQLRRAHSDLHVATSASVAEMRPSFLNAFGAVVDLAGETPESFLRDLVVRNVPVVAVNREPKTYSTHAVLADLVLGSQRIARDLLCAGHRRLAAVEPEGSNSISQTLRQFASRYRSGGEAVIETLSPAELESGQGVAALVESGVTAVVCDSVRTVSRVKAGLERFGVEVPGKISLTSIGCLFGGQMACPCSGYFVDCEPLADAVVKLLQDGPPPRPTTLWLVGEFIDRGTLGPAMIANGERPWLQFGDAVA